MKKKKKGEEKKDLLRNEKRNEKCYIIVETLEVFININHC